MAPYDSLEYALPMSLFEILFLIFLNWVIERFVVSGFLYIFFILCITFVSYLWKSRTAHRKITRHEAATCAPSVRENAFEEPAKENHVEIPIKEKYGAAAASTQDPRKLSIGEVNTIIELFDEHYNSTDNLGLSTEIEELFEEEPSLGELKEAFDAFDENGDGFIDAQDLKKVLSAMGFTVASEDECKRMISAYDSNGDGRIDFGEFVRVIELSFC